MGKGRAPCCDRNKVKRGSWSRAEDLILISFIHTHGHPNWRALPAQAGLLRCGKSCRLRWINYLRPGLKRGHFSPQEEETIINLHSSLGNKWSKIASHLPGRTDNEIKNVWNTYLRKRAMRKAEETASSSCSIITSSGHQKNVDKGCDEDQECIKIDEQKQHLEDSESPHYSSSCVSSGGNTLAHFEPLEIPLEKADIDDFLNILDSLETSQECPNLFQSSEYVHGEREARIDKTIPVEDDEQLQHKKWLRNLEYELGLEVQTE